MQRDSLDRPEVPRNGWSWLAEVFSQVARWCWRRAWPVWSIHGDGFRYRGWRFGAEPERWKTVVRRDPCPYCYAPSETVEHVTPLAQGGHDRPDNLVGACKRCNGLKGTLPLLTFLLIRQGRPPLRPVPPTVHQQQATRRIATLAEIARLRTARRRRTARRHRSRQLV